MGSAERRLPGSTRPPYACRRSGPFPRRGPIIMGRRLLLLVAMALTVGSGSRRAHAQPGEIPPAEEAQSPSKVEPLPEPAPLPDPAEVAPAASPKPDPADPDASSPSVDAGPVEPLEPLPAAPPLPPPAAKDAKPTEKGATAEAPVDREVD